MATRRASSADGFPRHILTADTPHPRLAGAFLNSFDAPCTRGVNRPFRTFAGHYQSLRLPAGSIPADRSMLESMMYIGIGFLFAALIAVGVVSLVHNRAVRLTTRRLEAAIPPSITEVQAEKDLQRAEFAMATRRLEMTIDQLKGNQCREL